MDLAGCTPVGASRPRHGSRLDPHLRDRRGQQRRTALNTVQAYNPSTNSWTTKASLPAARPSGNGATHITGTIYVPGGQDAAGVITRTLYAYKISTNLWSTKATMPVFSGCGGSGVISGKLYVYSGCTKTGTGPQTAAGLLHRYDPIADA